MIFISFLFVRDNGQLSGDVLVYRNPGLHFGDIHILKAVYVKELEDFIGNAKYGIFFSIKGQRSAAAEIANGDFDGDVYWVSRNRQVGSHPKISLFMYLIVGFFYSISQLVWSMLYKTKSIRNPLNGGTLLLTVPILARVLVIRYI